MQAYPAAKQRQLTLVATVALLFPAALCKILIEPTVSSIEYLDFQKPLMSSNSTIETPCSRFLKQCQILYNLVHHSHCERASCCSSGLALLNRICAVIGKVTSSP